MKPSEALTETKRQQSIDGATSALKDLLSMGEISELTRPIYLRSGGERYIDLLIDRSGLRQHSDGCLMSNEEYWSVEPHKYRDIVKTYDLSAEELEKIKSSLR